MMIDDRRGPYVEQAPGAPLAEKQDSVLNMVVVGIAVFILCSCVGGCVAFVKVMF